MSRHPRSLFPGLVTRCLCRFRFTGDDKELSVEDRGDRFPYPYQKVYTIQLYSPVSWEVRRQSAEHREWASACEGLQSETIACHRWQALRK